MIWDLFANILFTLNNQSCFGSLAIGLVRSTLYVVGINNIADENYSCFLWINWFCTLEAVIVTFFPCVIFPGRVDSSEVSKFYMFIKFRGLETNCDWCISSFLRNTTRYSNFPVLSNHPGNRWWNQQATLPLLLGPRNYLNAPLKLSFWSFPSRMETPNFQIADCRVACFFLGSIRSFR